MPTKATKYAKPFIFGVALPPFVFLFYHACGGLNFWLCDGNADIPQRDNLIRRGSSYNMR